MTMDDLSKHMTTHFLSLFDKFEEFKDHKFKFVDVGSFSKGRYGNLERQYE